jgi:hypothetical protein
MARLFGRYARRMMASIERYPERPPTVHPMTKRMSSLQHTVSRAFSDRRRLARLAESRNLPSLREKEPCAKCCRGNRANGARLDTAGGRRRWLKITPWRDSGAF